MLLLRLPLGLLVLEEEVYCLTERLGAEVHEALIDRARGIFGGDGGACLQEDVARIELVLEAEGGDARLRVAIDHCPVYGGGTSVAGEEGAVEVDRAEAGERPDDLG